jgi:hypothetical protein
MRNLPLLSLLSLLCALLLSGCGKQIPEVEDPHHIVVDGKPMTAEDFQKRYCQGSRGAQNPSCEVVSRAIIADFARPHGLPKGW